MDTIRYTVQSAVDLLYECGLGSKTQLRKDVAGGAYKLVDANRGRVRVLPEHYCVWEIVEGDPKRMWLMTREEIRERFQ